MAASSKTQQVSRDELVRAIAHQMLHPQTTAAAPSGLTVSERLGNAAASPGAGAGEILGGLAAAWRNGSVRYQLAKERQALRSAEALVTYRERHGLM